MIDKAAIQALDHYICDSVEYDDAVRMVAREFNLNPEQVERLKEVYERQKDFEDASKNLNIQIDNTSANADTAMDQVIDYMGQDFQGLIDSVKDQFENPEQNT